MMEWPGQAEIRLTLKLLMDTFVIKSFHLLTLTDSLTHNVNWTSVAHIPPEKKKKKHSSKVCLKGKLESPRKNIF